MPKHLGGLAAQQRHVYASATALTPQAARPLTVEDVKRVAVKRGLHLHIKTLGPAYEVVCQDGSAGPEGVTLGTSSGLVLAPLKVLHCDKMEVYARSKRGAVGERIRGGLLGLGLIIAMAVFAHGFESGCTKAEILAINDDEMWHQRLVRHYVKMYGFRTIKVVSGSLRDIPDMLIWGGVGTRMDADIESQLRRWRPVLLRESQI